jgi:glycosyltransferase involved in cell wall biosynthesis
MKVALVHDAHFPVWAYGGTERVVWWLAKGLAERGVQVILAGKPGSTCPFAETPAVDLSLPVEDQVPGLDVVHHFVTPAVEPAIPHVVTIGGNGQPGETYLTNTAFVSRNHAERHGATCYVHNGVDPADYEYGERKDPSLLFLAKASWKVKNVRGAIRLARRASRPLNIVGGQRWLFKRWRGTRWCGMLGGRAKASVIARSAALLFPVLWDEPFGLAVIEAMVSGTPVLATPFGSLPELVAPQTGQLCRSDEEFLSALSALDRYRPAECRDWALAHFSYGRMADRYLDLYRTVIGGQRLNAAAPQVRGCAGKRYSLPDRSA